MDSLEQLLKDLLAYGEEALLIDESMAFRITFFLKMEQEKKQALIEQPPE